MNVLFLGEIVGKPGIFTIKHLKVKTFYRGVIRQIFCAVLKCFTGKMALA